ncbi:MAG TPA: ECF transporter S component [Lachnospiraceae bacterium]|nr:ECF transporter S component [Lachnospiraceae bacterium]
MNRTKKITLTAVLSALAFITVALCRIPVVLFLSYEPKDVIITLGGFILGPIAAVIISLVSSFLEMVTISSTGIIGFVMNVIQSCAYACTATLIYNKKHTVKNAIIGLVCAVIFMTVVMLVWNYCITPIYMKVDRSQVVPLLIPAILPFNILKGSVNMALILLVYKPIITALRKSGIVPESKSSSSFGLNAWAVIAAIIAVTVAAILFFIIKGAS